MTKRHKSPGLPGFSRPPTGGKLTPVSGKGTRLASRDLAKTREQFEPTPSSPIRRAARMAGVE